MQALQLVHRQLEELEKELLFFGNSGKSALELKIQSQIAAGCQRRSAKFIRETFEFYKEGGCDYISCGRLFDALKDLQIDIPIQTEQKKEYFLELDVDSDGKINFDEFQKAVERPSELEKYLGQIPIVKIISDAIPRDHGQDPLVSFSVLTSDTINKIVQCCIDPIKKSIADYVLRLKTTMEHTMKVANELKNPNSKFCCYKMSASSASDFERGLEGRIGENIDFRVVDCMHNLRLL